ncbi:MAG: hypothetical protein L6Q29_04515 [Candidatus Pacebacteria bacterium]|nr:hypothetical protein [Candidatus Paceibacterota bacterium]NUQ57369.1 hypothetical protein [Candidatus Paceibacter sp.]
MAETRAVDNTDRSAEKKSKCSNFLAFLFFALFVCGLFAGFVYINETTNTPLYLNDELIAKVNELAKKINGKILVIERDGFSDSKNYRELKEIQNEFNLIRDKLVEIKIRMKNKTWAN